VEITVYLRLIKHWWWLLLLATFTAGMGGYIKALQVPTTYSATATLSIGNFIQSANPDSDAIFTGMQLVPTYSYLVTSHGVLAETARALNAGLAAGDLAGMISIQTVPDTSLVHITVTDADPLLVADIANELAHQLIAHSPTNLTLEQRDQMRFADAQIERLNQQLETMYQQLNLIDSSLSANPTSAEIERLNADRLAIVDQINYATAVVADFSVSITSLQQRTNSVEVIEYARPPESAGDRNTVKLALFAAVFGAALASGLVLAFEYLNDKLRTPQDVVQALTVPVLASAARNQPPRWRKKGDPLISHETPGAPFAEIYNAARTNLLALHNGAETPTYLVTSAFPREGKSLTCANLAITMARANQRVLLIDADLRMPRLHSIFNLNNQTGLSTLLLSYEADAVTPEDNGRYRQILRDCIQETDIPNLTVLTSGPTPGQSPSVMLGSPLMQKWLAVFQSLSNIDVILIDTPPALVVPDSVALAFNTHAQPLLVIESGKTDRAAATNVVSQFAHIDRPVLGVVLNKVKSAGRDYYGYYGDYYSANELPAHTGTIPPARYKDSA
jgi:polysaccharide biosynthesis transport protein